MHILYPTHTPCSYPTVVRYLKIYSSDVNNHALSECTINTAKAQVCRIMWVWQQPKQGSIEPPPPPPPTHPRVRACIARFISRYNSGACNRRGIDKAGQTDLQFIVSPYYFIYSGTPNSKRSNWRV